MKLSPAKEANRLSQILDLFHQTHGDARFPVDVAKLALECGELFNLADRIVGIEPAPIRGFEGGLFRTGQSEWRILYNDTLSSEGRIRFTQAHELGHYILHRAAQDAFECTTRDMLEWSATERVIESEADKFASYLLMPLHDFRSQAAGDVDLNLLGRCAGRYGVSLTAAILQWLSHTDEKAVVVLSRDGFMDWSFASEPAFKSGAFFPTRKKVIEIPGSTLAADARVLHDKQGLSIAGRAWFPHAEQAMRLREMKLSAEQYDCTLTLLVLPKAADVWAPRERTWERD
ncbi:ImmA/IrrE family metallo-endopeptidase [Paraburkholderia fungorum]|uniref:ImmA/IrrE family metallo-endopeptidase n=1 Tax=Paraburkholderia fungorum TaxID=134537 RepID=UPI0038BA8C16